MGQDTSSSVNMKQLSALSFNKILSLNRIFSFGVKLLTDDEEYDETSNVLFDFGFFDEGTALTSNNSSKDLILWDRKYLSFSPCRGNYALKINNRLLY